jgi:hypothetical protein
MSFFLPPLSLSENESTFDGVWSYVRVKFYVSNDIFVFHFGSLMLVDQLELSCLKGFSSHPSTRAFAFEASDFFIISTLETCLH